MPRSVVHTPSSRGSQRYTPTGWTPGSGSVRNVLNAAAWTAGRVARHALESVGSRRSSNASMASSRSVRGSRRTPRGAGSTKVGERKVITKRKHVKGVEPRKHKKVKVSKKFKAKVAAVLEKKVYHSGYALEIGAVPLPQISPKTQLPFNAIGLPVDNVTPLGSLFSPTQVLSIASNLWNNKAYVAGGTQRYTDAGNFPLNAKIKVRKLWAVFKLVNLGQRTYQIDAIVCKPKSRTINWDPLTDWNSSLTADNDVTKKVNVSGVLSTQLYAHPTMSKTFNANWKTETSKIVLEPGQTYDFHVQGPMNHEYKYQKFVNSGGNFTMNDPQTTRYILFVVRPDLLGGVTNTNTVFAAYPGTEPITGTPNSLGAQLHIEYRYHYSLHCPDSAGWVSTGAAPAAGGVPLFERRDAYAVYDNTYTVLATDKVLRIDEENPAVVEGGTTNTLS